MNINVLKPRHDLGQDTKLSKLYFQFEELLSELSKKELPDAIVASINNDVDEINAIPEAGTQLQKAIKSRQTSLIRLLEKELKIVPKSYYRNLWLALGMSAFGLPIGVAIGLSLGNLAFLGVGLPIGLGIGMAMGTAMDKKALAEGRQLDLEIKY